MPDFPLGITMGMMLSLPMVLIGAAMMAMAWTGRTTPARA
jgi:phosphatidylglycerol:prolipoprotein diacylglycerol transferase